MSPLSAGSESSGSSFLSSEVFVAEKGDGVANRGLGVATAVTAQTLLETFLENFCTWDYFLQLLKYHEF